jgi:hypothetical protein
MQREPTGFWGLILLNFADAIGDALGYFLVDLGDFIFFFVLKRVSVIDGVVFDDGGLVRSKSRLFDISRPFKVKIVHGSNVFHFEDDL